MEGAEPQKDPMLWDVDTVFQQLCSPDRPWLRDSAALAASIFEQGLDGRTLLTFEHYFSRKDLMEALGFTTARQKALIVDEIINWQAKSSLYRAWKKAFQARLAMTDTVEEPPARETPQTAYAQGEPAPASPPSANGSALAEHVSPPPNGVQPVAVGELNHDDDDRPLKKRRIVPINLNTEPLSDTSLLAPEFQIQDPAFVPANQDHRETDPFAYLGSNVLDVRSLKFRSGPVHPQVIELSGGSFAVAMTNKLPPGLRQVVAGTIRSLLSSNGRQERLINEGFAIMRSPSPSEEEDREEDADDDQEDVVDVSDLPEEWDEETRREIEEEQAEAAARERESARCLPSERVEAILQEALNTMKVKWEERKLPQHQRKAFEIWTAARKRERVKEQILKAHRMAQFHDSKITQMKAEILRDKWQKEQDVRDQALIMEQRLHDKLFQSWLVSLLESRVQPDRPITVPKPRSSVPKVRASLFDDEVLTSDDDMDDFIVQDEEPLKVSVETMDLDNVRTTPQPPLPQSPGGSFPEVQSPVVLDLTQIETSPEPSIRGRSPASTRRQRPKPGIDLTTPLSGREEDSEKPEGRWLKLGVATATPPPTEDLEDVQAIAKSAPSYWSQNKDRWRLIISMIFRLGHKRRQALFSFLRHKTPAQIWQSSIQKHLDGGPIVESELPRMGQARLVAIDLTRVFLSLIRCQGTPQKRILGLNGKDIIKLRTNSGGPFSTLVAFIQDSAPLFPSDEQILTVEAPDDWSDDIDIPDDQGPSNTRRRIRREIVQDKDALDLREREKRRVQEQDARRLKLIAQMETAGVASRDTNRLIINASKQEDEGFIYVNGEIGRRIKDHQVNGVRFLWNQIIRDIDVRQGCLLAHTMGLGKTMQVITFLVAIVEAASSTDASVRDQVPEDLRRSQTLVICPAGLVDNWIDELLRWAPKDLLGDIRKVESSMILSERYETVQDWVESGGLLIIGYEMFQRACRDKDDDPEEAEEVSMGKLLLKTPSVVVADEAHMLKNPKTRLHQTCSQFRTRSRIALTGTPLSNNVEEYHTMIDWVAPNFLGPLKEFRETYCAPISRGLEADSGPGEKREALLMLEVLKRTIAPKVNRADISSIKHDLPPKHEFILFVTRTEMQKKLYDRYIDAVAGVERKSGVAFSKTNDLTLICNHPRCYGVKLKWRNKNSVPETEWGSQIKEQMLSFILKETLSQDMNDPGLSLKVEMLLLILDEARRVGEKVIVFSQSIPTLDYLENLLSTMQQRMVCRLDGDTKVTVRHEVTKNFNKGLYDVYLISSKAGGVGLNMQGATRVVIFDIKYNPAVTQQAIGRAYRIGQTKTVYVYHLMVAGTFEQVLHDSSVFKMQLASRVVDKKNPVSWGKRGGAYGPLQEVPWEDLGPFLHKDAILDRLILHKPDSHAIKKIISTDTFEEEDISAQVTQEMHFQIEERIKWEEIRRNDPEAYERMMIQRQTEGLGPLQAASAGGFHQGLDGASDMRYSPARFPYAGPSLTLPIQTHSPHLPPPSQAMPFSQSALPVPPPMAGANTYFKEAGILQSASDHRPVSETSAPEPLASVPLPKKGGIFGPGQSPARDEFEKKLGQELQLVPGLTEFRPGETFDQMAESITAGIAGHLREQAQGFLYDNKRWSLLSKLCNGRGFVWAVASGRLRMDSLARSRAEELERTVLVFESLTDGEKREQLQRIVAPDPNNLGNIEKSRSQSARASEDLEAMRQLANKRSQRGPRLPHWASQALSRNASEGP